MTIDTPEDLFHLGVKALIRDNDGKILLLQVNPAKLKDDQTTYWDLPGGRVQKGQTILEALKREIVEETGVTGAEVAKEVGMVLSNVRIPIGDETVGLVLDVYECHLPANAKVELSDEHVAYNWFTPAEAAGLLAVKYPDRFCELIAAL